MVEKLIIFWRKILCLLKNHLWDGIPGILSDRIFLKNYRHNTGDGNRKNQTGAQKLPGFLLFALGHASCHAAGQCQLDSCGGKGEAEGIDWKDKLVQAHAFLPKGMA